MPYATNGGVRIRYEVEGNGPPLVLHPGLRGKHRRLGRWRVRCRPADRYQLVLLDPRGQGSSDEPRIRRRSPDGIESEMSWLSWTQQVLTGPTLGYSMGGWIGFALGMDAPDRLSSLVLGGAPHHSRATRVR